MTCYLNAAGAALCSDAVVQAQIDYLRKEQQLGGYICANEHASDWQQLYRLIGRLLNCDAHHIALQESASRGLLNALLAVPWRRGDQVLVTDYEYGANYVALLQLQQRFELEITVVKARSGELTAQDWLEHLTDKTRVILLTWCPSHNGIILPAYELAGVLNSFNGYFIVDACQAVGQMAVDVKRLKCDFLVATGRKFLRGPRGTGFLYASDRVLSEGLFPMVTDHFAAHWQSEQQFQLSSSAKRFELWEANWAARLGLKVAVQLLLESEQETYFQIQQNAVELRQQLAHVANLSLHDSGAFQSAIISFSLNSVAAEQVFQRLLKQGFVTSLITRDTSLIDMNNRDLPELNRASVHVYNHPGEFQQLAESLSQIQRAPLTS